MPKESHLAVFIETHGCKLNQADSQVLARRFLQAGYRLEERPERADVYVVNTCTVTHVADRKARHALRDARRHNPRAVVVATGCYAHRAPHQLAQLDAADVVLGNTQKDAIVDSVNRVLGIASMPSSTAGLQPPGGVATLRTRAMVKVQEGCDQVCAYCVVPKVRGRGRSVHPDSVIARTQLLVAEGYQEVVLTGTQLGAYGFDIPGASLAGLIGQILYRTSVPRLRVSSLQPQELDAGLLELWHDPRLCPHFHLPLQSGSAEVLTAMRRRYSPSQYIATVEVIRREIPGAAVTSDVIVGFPGETEARFQQTYKLCRGIEFAGLHVFPYSVRPGTTAIYLEPKVEAKERRVRMEKMLALAREQAHSYRRSLLGTARPVLWETSHATADAQVWSGLTDNYIRVATTSPQPLCNRITPLVLEHQVGEVVWGRIA